MQQTKNYQLSQWEKEDRILMEDFNGDNEKIDAAVKAVEARAAAEAARLEAAKAGFVRLADITASLDSASGSLTLGAPGLRLEAFLLAVLEFQLPAGSGSFYLRPNDVGGYTYSFGAVSSSGGGAASLAAGRTHRLLVAPMGEAAARFTCYGLDGQMCAGQSECTFGALRSFTFQPESRENTLSGVCRLRVSGIK